jgi:iron complex outermembrane receptor protein
MLMRSNKYLDLVLLQLMVLFPSFMLHGQTTRDTLHLPEFEIKSNYPIDNRGFKRVRLDSVTLVPYRSSDLSTILSGYSTIFIKSYGNGTLATPSFRGTTAQHTQVEWNGINLNSPMLGQIDLSLIPVSQFDGIEILYGAAGLFRTSGAFGGVINLVTGPDWNNRIGLSVSQTFASFDNYVTILGANLGTRNFQSHTRFNYSSGLNDFPYYNDYLREEVRQQNASFRALGISQEFFWKLKDKHLFSAKAWYSYSDRNLPPTTTTPIDSGYLEKELDRSLRAVLEYKYIEPGMNLMVHSAISDQFMNYQNSILDADHRSDSWINRVRFSWSRIRNLTIKPGIDFTYDWVNSDSYDGTKTRTTTSLFAEVNYTIASWIVSSLVLRDDIIDGKFMPVIGSLGFEFRPVKKANLAFTLNGARNFRYPTLNDLYWEVSGNPDLSPETNYITELGTTFNYLSRNKRFFFETTLSGYYSWMFDMIIWTPVEGNSSLWRPENVSQVNARGIEVSGKLNWDLWGFDLGLNANYTFCRSTNEKATSPEDQKAGKQLIYVPENNLNSTLSLERWKFFLKYNFLFVDKRYTSTDNQNYMPAYTLSNIILGKDILLKDFILSLQVQINNLFNLDYQSVASRPMPGINCAFTIKLSFSNTESK